MSEPWPDDPREFLLAYLAAWNAGDVDRVCDAYLVPALIYHPDGLEANLDDAARRAYLGGYVESTREELAAGTRWECPSLEITRLGNKAALVTARWVFRRTDGTALEDYPDTYVLVWLGGRWVFMADVIYESAESSAD